MQAPPSPPPTEKKKQGAGGKITRKEKKDLRILVRMSEGCRPEEDPVELSRFRDYIPPEAKPLVQKITKTKTGVALWPFRGLRSGLALQKQLPVIAAHWNKERIDDRLELPVRRYSYVVENLTQKLIAAMGKGEIRASSGVNPVLAIRRSKVVEGVTTYHAVIHFDKKPQPFSVFGHRARLVEGGAGTKHQK